MAYNPLPRSFFGVDYSASTGNITLGTLGKTSGAIAASFTAAPVANVITTTGYHFLKPGDAIQFSVAASPFSVGTTYFVKTVGESVVGAGFNRLTVSATAGGAELTATTAPQTASTISALGLLYEVSDVEAAPLTGDWRKVISGLMEMLFRRWTGIPLADRPAKLTVSRASSVDPTTLEVVLTYTVRVVNAPAALEVAGE